MLDPQSEKFRVVFSLVNQPMFGWLVECYAIKEGESGNLMLSSQKVRAGTADDFGLNEKQKTLVSWLEDIDKKAIIKRFNKLKRLVHPDEFFKKQYTPELKKLIREFVESRVIKTLELLEGEEIYLCSEDMLNPAHRKLSYPKEKSGVMFHLFKNEDGMQYFANIRYDDSTVSYRQNDSIILTEQPVWMVVENQLIQLEDSIESKKVSPFIDKKFISIPLASEKLYLEKFIIPLVEKHQVFAKGINVLTERFKAKPILKLIQMGDGLSLILMFDYGGHLFNYNTKKRVYAMLEDGMDGEYLIKRIQRSAVWEEQKKSVLEECGFINQIGSSFHVEEPETLLSRKGLDTELMELLVSSKENLMKAGFEIEQDLPKENYLIEEPKLEINSKDEGDYFDVKIEVKFGKFSVPFTDLISNIKNQKPNFVLPDKSIGVIPMEWFTKYLPIASLGELNKNKITLKKHHEVLLKDLDDTTAVSELPLESKLKSKVVVPKKLKTKLRDYQKEGLIWMAYLHSISCGGILADDMGLGKTIQVIAFLGHLKETQSSKLPHLVLAPTSLVYNWEAELKKFYPDINFVVHLGSQREKNIKKAIGKHEVLITSYGTFRSDIENFEKEEFNVVITDESQSYKNRNSQLHKALNRLNVNVIFGLTGTPIENGVTDLWSQMDVINKKMLGGYSYFKRTFADPIEKQEDVKAAKQLQKIIDPLVLRRTKKQVISELPEKTEHTIYCDMTEGQSKLYEEVKSYYRNQLLEVVEDVGFEAGRMKILAGLMKLRQIANHPNLAGYDEVNESGKLLQICQKIAVALEGDHKVLVFSQFLGHLGLIQEYLENQQINFAYIDGKMDAKQRNAEVKRFQTNKECKVFLLSIKTGDKGLNLTAADYVMIADPWWNPAVEQQAQDRAYRIGQDKPVFIYKFISKNTIEDKIKNLQSKKKSYANQIIVETENVKQSFDKDSFKLLFE